jgi:hypothetical protein
MIVGVTVISKKKKESKGRSSFSPKLREFKRVPDALLG